MKRLIDVVNFNADASCLTSAHWMEALAGGRSSAFFRWAQLYVRYRKKIVLGFTGATLADIRRFNPETLGLINEHPEVFGTVERPFSHDIHLLRRPRSFRFNLQAGIRARQTCLPALRAPRFYLPPEFMLAGEQVNCLASLGLRGVLINASRFAPDVQERIPRDPYWLRGLLGVRVGCVPICGTLTHSYLHCIQQFEGHVWNEAVTSVDASAAVLWRDGESSFLLPDGVQREEFWLAQESNGIERCHLEDLGPVSEPTDADRGDCITHFPVHSFAAWMKEFRMLGFLGRVGQYEDACIGGTPEEAALWFGLINSDVLSAVEKRPVRITLRARPGSEGAASCVLHRTPREHEAEEYLLLLGQLREGGDIRPVLEAQKSPHMLKLKARIELLREMALVQ